MNKPGISAATTAVIAPIDIEEVKRVSARLTQRPAHDNAPPVSRALTENQKETQRTLQSFLTKAGFPIEQVDKLRASRQAELRRLFEAEVAENTKHFKTKEIGFRQSVDNRHEALRLLSSPFLSTFVTLDQPFLIWQFPNTTHGSGILLDSGTVPLASFIKLKGINLQSSEFFTQFVFHFLWHNASQFAAVINVQTSLVFNGTCKVDSAKGIFSGDLNTLSLLAHLDIIRWSGWGASDDQTALPFSQPSQSQQVADLSVRGDGLFGGEKTKAQAFDFQSFDLSRNLIAIPAGAVTMFKVTLDLYCHMDDPLNISDSIIFDFADTSAGRQIICPSVVLELLTPVGAGVTA